MSILDNGGLYFFLMIIELVWVGVENVSGMSANIAHLGSGEAGYTLALVLLY